MGLLYQKVRSEKLEVGSEKLKYTCRRAWKIVESEAISAVNITSLQAKFLGFGFWVLGYGFLGFAF